MLFPPSSLAALVGDFSDFLKVLHEQKEDIIWAQLTLEGQEEAEVQHLFFLLAGLPH